MRGVLVPIPEHRGKVLFLATSREDLDGDEAFLHRAMLVAFIVAVGWVVAVAYWLGGRLTVAHDAVAETVRKITQGDLSARVRIEHSDAEVAQVAADINEMVDQLGKLLASQQRFIANAAHELRSPLATLHGELQQAVRKKRDAASYEQAIHSALTASRRLTRLVQDLLTLARVTSRNTDQAASVEVMAAIREARAEVAPFAAERGVTLDVDLDVSCTVPDRGGDTARLFRNLLENAIRHSPEHGTVHVVGTCSGNTILIRISDQGPGVPVADHEAVFEPFFRGKGATPGEGAGLGLGIAREIARSHRGDVILDRSNAIGAQFVVSLPVVLRVGLKT
jgi:two-component system heavy metal sensor histidine kinase CusS